MAGPTLARVAPIAPAGTLRTIVRGLALRCPRCGVGRLYARWFRMHAACPECGYKFEREPGYFVGAIYLNYGATILFALGVPWVLDVLVGLPLARQLTIAVVLALGLPLVVHRHGKGLWLAVDYVATRADEQAEATRRRP